MKVLSWDEYFMALAQITAMRSKDANTRVGAVLVNAKKRIVGLGYNGMPNGDDTFPWTREGASAEQTKYPYVIHAELNAVLNANGNVDGATLYVSLFPCSACAKLMAQAGIKEIVYADDKYHDTEDDKIAHRILQKLKVKTRHYVAPEVVVKLTK